MICPLCVRTRDVELLAGAGVDDGVVKGALGEHGSEGLLDEMVLALDQHLRNSLSAEGRLGQRGERLNGLWCDLLRPKLRLRKVISPLSHFSVAIDNIPVLLKPAQHKVKHKAAPRLLQNAHTCLGV